MALVDSLITSRRLVSVMAASAVVASRVRSAASMWDALGDVLLCLTVVLILLSAFALGSLVQP